MDIFNIFNLKLKNLTTKQNNILSILILILLCVIVVLTTLGITNPGRFTENKKTQTYIKNISIVSSLLIGVLIFAPPLYYTSLAEIKRIKNDITR